MAFTELYAGSFAVSTTEYDLPSASTSIGAITTDGVYQLFLDLNALVAGDTYELRCYEKVGAATTQRVLQTWQFVGVQADPIYVSPSLLLINGWTFTLKRTAGADRTINWSIRQVA